MNNIAEISPNLPIKMKIITVTVIKFIAENSGSFNFSIRQIPIIPPITDIKPDIIIEFNPIIIGVDKTSTIEITIDIIANINGNFTRKFLFCFCVIINFRSTMLAEFTILINFFTT